MYGVDLSDVFRGRVSWRRLLVLIRYLPADALLVSRLYADIDEPDALPDPEYDRLWTTDQALLAALVDAVRSLEHTFVTANSKRKPPPLDPLPRPGRRHPRIPRKRLSEAQRARIRRMNHHTEGDDSVH